MITVDVCESSKVSFNRPFLSLQRKLARPVVSCNESVTDRNGDGGDIRLLLLRLLTLLEQEI
jgi:hypothetical protein